MAGFSSGTTYKDLIYARRRYISVNALREATQYVDSHGQLTRMEYRHGDGYYSVDGYPLFDG